MNSMFYNHSETKTDRFHDHDSNQINKFDKFKQKETLIPNSNITSDHKSYQIMEQQPEQFIQHKKHELISKPNHINMYNLKNAPFVVDNRETEDTRRIINLIHQLPIGKQKKWLTLFGL